MGRILAIDYGTKRVGIAVTDSLKMIANGLTTVHAKDLMAFLKDYLSKEEVESIVVGEPKRMSNEAAQTEIHIAPFVKKLQKEFPGMKIERYDERFTSKIAFQSMIAGGLKKKDRRDKALVDKISATLILQSYLEHQNQN